MQNLIARITINPNVCKGKPSIRNMRFTVVQLLELLASGLDFSEVLEDIVACLLYASKIANTKNVITIPA